MMNGTSIYGADDLETSTEIRNFTYNATDFNQLFMTFTPNFDEDPQPFFMAYVGLVPRIQYWDQDEESTKKPGAVPVDNTIFKYITLNEKIIMLTVLCGIFAHCIKKKYFDNWKLGINKFRRFELWKQRKAGMERIILKKHPYDPWG